MFFIFLACLIISSTLLVSNSIGSYINRGKTNTKLTTALWLINLTLVFLLCSNLAHIGLIINPQAPDYSFFDTIDLQYFSIFIVDSAIIAIVFAFYWLITRKLNFAPYWFLLLLVGWTLYQYYPGIPSADGIDTSYNQYLAHSYTDFQPPLFTLWWNIFHLKSAAFIMNSLFYYGGLIYISYYLHTKKLKWQNDVLVLFCLNPILFTQLAIVWKDVSFTGFAIDCVAIYLAIPTIQKPSIRRILWVIYFALIFLAIGFRFNGNLTVLPFAIAGFYQIISQNISKSRKVIGSVLLGFVTVSIFTAMNFFIAYKIFDAKQTNIQRAVMLLNLGGMECWSNHAYQIDTKYFIPATEDSREVFCDHVVNYYNIDAYVLNWSGTGVNLIDNASEHPEVKSLFLEAVTKHPLIFLSFRGAFFTNVIFNNYWYPTGTLFETPDLMSKVATFQKLDMKIELPLFMLATTIALLFCCIYYRIYGLSLVILISSILQLISLYLLVPNHSARYYFWNYIGAALALALIVLDIKKQHSEKSVTKSLDVKSKAKKNKSNNN